MSKYHKQIAKKRAEQRTSDLISKCKSNARKSRLSVKENKIKNFDHVYICKFIIMI